MMKNFFQKNFPFTVKLRKQMKSRLNKDGFALADAIIAFTILTVLVVLITGFIGTKVRTTATITFDAEDHQASLTAVAQSLHKTTMLSEIDLNITSYVPVRNSTSPNEIHIFNNYNSDTDFLTHVSGVSYEVISKNIITGSRMSLTGNAVNKQFYHDVTTSKFLGAKFSFEPITNLNVVKGKASGEGYFYIVRAKDFNQLPSVKTLNSPVDYNAVEVFNYENHSN